jgi:signal transduction histidine kinase
LALLLEQKGLLDIGMVDWGALLKSLVADWMGRIPSRVTFRVHIDASQAAVDGDRDLLKAAIDNLLKNALEAMPDSGTLSLESAFLADDGRVVLEIADTGPGIPPSVVDAVNEGSPPESCKRDGIGLGLLSVRWITRAHGGSLELRRRLDTTIAALELPARPVERQEEMRERGE